MGGWGNIPRVLKHTKEYSEGWYTGYTAYYTFGEVYRWVYRRVYSVYRCIQLGILGIQARVYRGIQATGGPYTSLKV